MKLNDSTYQYYAAQNYTNPDCIEIDEFLEDLNRIKYLKKLFYAYKKSGILRERLIINHLVVLYNVFERKACTKMLFFKLKEYHNYLKPFLLYLDYLPETVDTDVEVIHTVDIEMDQPIIDVLRSMERERKKL